MDFDQQVSLRNAFMKSYQLLSERHLHVSARWSSEALNGMPSLSAEQQYAEYQLMKRNLNRKTLNASQVTSPVLSSGLFESNTSGSALGVHTTTSSDAAPESVVTTGLPIANTASNNANSINNTSTRVNQTIKQTPTINTGNFYTSEINSSATDQEEYLQFIERDRIAVASSYLNCKEFNRCHHILKGCRSAKAVFIRLYALYLSGEKKKSLDSSTILSQNDTSNQNPYLSIIMKELEEYKSQQKSTALSDPFLLYLQGIVFLKSKKLTHAQEMFYQSVSSYPLNWSCWKDLISSLSTFSDALKIISKLKKNTNFVDKKEFHLMFLFFKITVYQEFFQISNEILINLNDLAEIFPNFSFLKTQKALISYNELDYSTAENIFDDILKSDPMRLDEMDIYSNILYVMENKSKLSYLAHYASEVDSLRPETCCIIANYYSIKFDHQKAIMYYKRALSLSQDCLSAWTLMGHEFVELKNSNAAIESYRRAVDTNNKDFRAWYGLGQAYEVLDMHLYSLYYYQRACSLKPLDKRMWQAIGNCCEKLQEFEDSIKAYKKALSVSIDPDPMILYKLGILYSSLDDYKNAKEYMKLCLNEEHNGDVSDETTKARLWLAKCEVSNRNWQLAYNYAIELTQGTSQEIEEARAIAREARMKLNMASNVTTGFL